MFELRRIGAGCCGTVWAPTQRDRFVFKREDGGPGRSLSNDFEMHQRVLESLHQFARSSATDLSLCIQVPQCYRFIEAGDQEWWDKNLTSFPRGYSPCNVLHSERIMPLPRNIRELLIDKYCPTLLIPEIKASQAITAFLRNDPFYPRPGQLLWKRFRDQYLQTSSNIISSDRDEQRTSLPKMFIRGVEEAQQKRNER
ncbi:MAG: hypothetical protein M1839_005839 [Geoglossum umbratile]|nr:MAG: hypothetical protein M1839_005839 [Geoglossum umbratile]